MKIDLHSHSIYSDGHLTPKELIDRAHNMQVDILALTDHDTVQGFDELQQYQATQKRRLAIVSGVEISTAWHGFDIHVLGLNFDLDDSVLLKRLQEQGQRREERAQKIDIKLTKAGVTGILPIAKSLAGKGQITRAHFARALVRAHAVKDMDDAFKKYLGKGKKAHVKPEWISIEQAISWIHGAGGRAALAHPGHYDMTAKWLRRLVDEFSSAGGDAMEVNHSHISAPKKQLLNELAVEHNLLASTGSDFHFPSRWTELGRVPPVAENLTPIWHDWTFPVLKDVL